MRSIYLATAYSYKSDGKWFKRISKLAEYYPFSYLMQLFLARRYREVTKVCAKIMTRNNIVFSPITHSHPVAVIGKLPALSHVFWLTQDKFWVDACDEIWVYEGLPYWESFGVKREIQWGLEAGKPVRLVNSEGMCTARIREILPHGQFLTDCNIS